MDDTTRFWCEALAQDIYIEGRVAHIELSYPRIEDNPHTLQIGLQDVRGADDIRVSYDFDRDGWKIEQRSVEELHCGDGTVYPVVIFGEWHELAFVKAWGLTIVHKETDIGVTEWLTKASESSNSAKTGDKMATGDR